MLSSISWRTPPRAYGPWELVTSLLTEALVARGVDVTLFATLDSQTSGKLEGVVPRGYSEDPGIDAKVAEALHISHVIERAGEFRGQYHVLGGRLSPLDGVGPDDLTVAALLARLEGTADAPAVREVIVATNPSLEGDATALFIQSQLAPRGIAVTRIARGLPVGGDLEYADEVTLGRALAGRRPA